MSVDLALAGARHRAATASAPGEGVVAERPALRGLGGGAGGRMTPLPAAERAERAERDRPAVAAPVAPHARGRGATAAPSRDLPPLVAVDARRAVERVVWQHLGVRAHWAARVALAIARDAAVVSGAAMLAGRAGLPVAAPAAFTVVTLLALAAAGRFRRGAPETGAARLLVSFAVAAISAGVAGVATGVATPQVVAALAALVGIGLAVADAGTRPILDRRAAPRTPLTAAAIVGHEADAAAVYLALAEAWPHALCDALHAPESRRERVRTGLPSRVKARLAAGDLREVVVVTPMRARGMRAIATSCWRAGVRCFVAFDAGDRPAGAALPVRLGTVPAWELVPETPRLPTLPIKRLLDLVITGMAMIVAVPLALLIAAAIRLDSRGPVFFRQRRVGLGGREFTIWKFRSMRAEDLACREELARLNPYGDAPLFKLAADPRITRVGQVLRRTSLDELPQLLNVLRGEMSLVGPRPPLPEEVRRYAPHHFVRLTVTPGMTGPWQVGGRNLITDFERIVAMEREYIERWSLALDLRILARTFGVVVRGTGAY